MEQQQKATITLDGKNYIVDDLSDNAKYCLGQLQDIQQQTQVTRAKLDQLSMADRGFLQALRDEIAKSEEPEEVVEGTIE